MTDQQNGSRSLNEVAKRVSAARAETVLAQSSHAKI